MRLTEAVAKHGDGIYFSPERDAHIVVWDGAVIGLNGLRIGKRPLVLSSKDVPGADWRPVSALPQSGFVGSAVPRRLWELLAPSGNYVLDIRTESGEVRRVVGFVDSDRYILWPQDDLSCCIGSSRFGKEGDCIQAIYEFVVDRLGEPVRSLPSQLATEIAARIWRRGFPSCEDMARAVDGVLKPENTCVYPGVVKSAW